MDQKYIAQHCGCASILVEEERGKKGKSKKTLEEVEGKEEEAKRCKEQKKPSCQVRQRG